MHHVERILRTGMRQGARRENLYIIDGSRARAAHPGQFMPFWRESNLRYAKSMGRMAGNLEIDTQLLRVRLARAGRRVLAKVVDIAAFGSVSLLLGRLLFPDQLAFAGLVPIFLTALWLLGFYVAADTVVARLLGATPGEYLAGIRVVMVDGSALTWSTRQDRTTDALAEGTFGALRLVRNLVTGQPASYDRDCIVRFRQAATTRHALAGFAIVALIGCLVSAGIWLSVLRGLNVEAEAATRRLLLRAGLPVQEVWVNPITGSRVLLPPTCSTVSASHNYSLGDMAFHFMCDSLPLPHEISIGVAFQLAAVALDPTRDTERSSMERNFRSILGEREVEFTDLRAELVGDARLAHVYPVELSSQGYADETRRSGLHWFVGRKHAWVMSITAPSAAAGSFGPAQELALELIQSTRGVRGD